MKLLLIEDSDKKTENVKKLVLNSEPHSEITIAKSQAAAVRQLTQNAFDLIILDVLIPHVDGAPPSNCRTGLLKEIEECRLNSKCPVIMLTEHEDVFDGLLQDFMDAGVLPILYSEDDERWKHSLSKALRRIKHLRQQDFLIICALDLEKDAFIQEGLMKDELEILEGLNVSSISIGELKGFVVVPPRMGLIDASVVSALSTKHFRPKIIAMSGICGGYKTNISLGQLVVATQCWEHQSGKFTPEGFEMEPYQWVLSEPTRLVLNKFIKDPGTQDYLYDGLVGGAKFKAQPKLAPVLSGSAVIADKTKADEIFDQHRKSAGVDMEMYGALRAIEIANHDTVCFGAKTVVDYLDAEKNDDVHEFGARVSARFVIKAIEELLRENI